MQIMLERQSKTIALSFHADNSIAYDELYLAVQDKMSAIVNGGKFFVGKAFTIVGNAVSVLSKNIYVQGLTVAAAGGLGSKLAGGSFELGFLTAGLAFAVNQVVTELAQEEITTTRTEDSILYERGTASVLVKNNDANGAIPTVGNRQVLDALDVSADVGSQVQIISGERRPGHPLYRPEGPHTLDGAIDVKISDFNSEQVADALHRSGNFNRVSSYTDGRTSAHADYRSRGNQGRFVDWIWQGN